MRAGFAEHAQLLLPMLEPIRNTRISVDEPMPDAGRALVEQLLVVSTQEVARVTSTLVARAATCAGMVLSPAGS